ncbi:MAG: Ig-like domain-containing protein, partial [Rubrobacteraceae bacterium]
AGATSEAFVWTVDATAPRVLRTNPASGARNVSARSPVVVTFSEKMNRATVSKTTVRLLKGRRAVPARVVYDAARNRAILKSSTRLAPKTSYSVLVVGKARGGKDLAGNPLAADRIWRFTTR